MMRASEGMGDMQRILDPQESTQETREGRRALDKNR